PINVLAIQLVNKQPQGGIEPHRDRRDSFFSIKCRKRYLVWPRFGSRPNSVAAPSIASLHEKTGRSATTLAISEPDLERFWFITRLLCSVALFDAQRLQHMVLSHSSDGAVRYGTQSRERILRSLESLKHVAIDGWPYVTLATMRKSCVQQDARCGRKIASLSAR